MWRGDGKELFYLTDDGKLMSAEANTGAAFYSGVAKQLFQTNIKRAPGPPYAAVFGWHALSHQHTC